MEGEGWGLSASLGQGQKAPLTCVAHALSLIAPYDLHVMGTVRPGCRW